jgi:transcriptional regulator with XRE-family HTH domain
MSTLAERCLEARLAAGYENRSEFARRIGTSPSAIQQIEDGRTRSLKADTLQGYVRVTGHSAEWLRTGTGSKFATPAQTAAASQDARPDDDIMSRAVELLYLLADARPDDWRFSRRLTWPMIKVAAKWIERGESQGEIVKGLLEELEGL